MTNNNIFELAIRNKMRFPFRGLVSVEDLWDLSVENLDSIFKTLNTQLKTVQEESLLNRKTKTDKELDLKIEIVKYIFNVKLEERELSLKEKERKEQKQKILEVLTDKQDEALKDKSIDELKKLLEQFEK
ncbi:hypothetical protein ACFQZE_06530 [Paenibacillus sp. GCM10027627]|uniref:hypothetical protein n=1 Tax=unclassified Paenibacillus TaxID=185978 RepID=UPI00362FD654